MKKYPIILVTYDDATIVNSISDPETEDFSPIRVQSVGWLIRDYADYVSVAHELLEDGRVKHVTTVPKGCIVSKQVLREQIKD